MTAKRMLDGDKSPYDVTNPGPQKKKTPQNKEKALRRLPNVPCWSTLIRTVEGKVPPWCCHDVDKKPPYSDGLDLSPVLVQLGTQPRDLLAYLNKSTISVMHLTSY